MGFKRKYTNDNGGTIVHKGHSNIVGVSKAGTSQQPAVRDQADRPLRWNEAIQDYEVDIARWVDETNQRSGD